jgi:transposase
LRDYLQAQAVTTVAMEATGVYWLCADAVLEAAGLEVLVVNGRHARKPARTQDRHGRLPVAGHVARPRMAAGRLCAARRDAFLHAAKDLAQY